MSSDLTAESTLDVLQEFLDSKEIPEVQSHTGFLEIIGKAHHENINSALYAHYINSTLDGVQNVFLEALIEIINGNSRKSIQFIKPFALTEQKTGTGRIDILIVDSQGENRIIIENKIYHSLDNDLKEYWNYVGVDESKKVGILLTLRPHEIPNKVQGDFINITHIEWIEKVKERIQFSSLPSSDQVYLNDFIQTILKLSSSYEMDEATQFYFENAEQVLKAEKTISAAHRFLKSQFERIAEGIGWQLYGSSMEWRNFWDEDNQINTYLTLSTEELLHGQMKYNLILELFNKDTASEQELKKLLEDHPQFSDKKRGDSGDLYTHFLCKEYSLKKEQLAFLAEHVLHNIRKDFADITLRSIQHNYPEIGKFKWEDKLLGR